MNKIIKLKTFQEKVVFRTPYSMEIIETYPLPPYSTILGFIHNMLSSSKTIDEINISVQGRYGNLVREFVRYHKYEVDKKEGKPYPIIVTSLLDLELIIHIKMPTDDLHHNLFAVLKAPPYFPYLGRPEDLISHIEVIEDEERNFDPLKTEEGCLTLHYNCYVQFDIANKLEIDGIPYVIPAYYKLISKSQGRRKKVQEIFRNFEMIKVIYAHSGQTITERIKTDTGKTPIWWMK
ncbi:MAG: CRISPR-associated protein Cas5 [Candidatus Omnitrophica bacterium]|nr:CRISPR-associated protein Cas5 [Candidatus Omnitrophota bacterium]